MDLIGELVLGLARGAGREKLEKQLVIPSSDLPKVAKSVRAHLKKNQADPKLADLSDAQLLSLVKAADQAIIEYVEFRVGL